MTKKKPSQSLYIIFGVIIAMLLALIGYFAYLLVAPNEPTKTTDTANSNTNATANTNTIVNKNSKKSKNNNQNKNVNTNTNSTNEGLVEPAEGITEDVDVEAEDAETNSNSNSNTNSEAASEEVVAGEGEEVITLYFAKTNSDCGEVFPIKRAVTPAEDFYGQIILAAMSGPTAAETGYSSVADSLRLRRVEYTSAGPTIYVDEAYNALSDCDQQTAEAQLVETANVMFDLPEGGAGEVIVGYPEDTEEDTAEETDEEVEE